jgi:phosphoribosyl 1,2-cyclic phosphodiesterase
LKRIPLTKSLGVVAKLQFKTFSKEVKKLNIEGIEIEPFEVFHGDNYMCSAFKFSNIVYMSDVSAIPEECRPMLENLDLLIIDCLARSLKLSIVESTKKFSISHLLLDGTIEEIRKIKPKKALLIGMCHSLEHNELNGELEKLKSEGLDVEVAYDGMSIDIELK